jgi:putative ABC transport system permease protein
MFKNYLITAFRNLKHDKFYALLNILGLAISITAAFFIFQYVQFERSYDTFHVNADNIYRLTGNLTINGIEQPPEHSGISTFPPAVKNEFPEVIEYARLTQRGMDNCVISYEPENGHQPSGFMVEKVYYAEPSFMEIFSFPVLAGDPVTGLEAPYSLLLSERLAKMFFGSNWQAADPIGKVLTINGDDSYMITGIFQDIPENSHIKFDVLLSLITLKDALDYDTEWVSSFPSYLLIDPSADIKHVEAKLMQIHERLFGELFRKLNIDTVQWKLQPVRDTHLYSGHFKEEPEVRGSATTVDFLFLIGIFILMLAWINFINLSSARAVTRSKEVGVRKAIGAARWQLVVQFLLEAFLINGLSLLFSIVLYLSCYPIFIGTVQKDIPLLYLLGEPFMLIVTAVLLLLGTLLSGGYSAFVLSSYKVIKVLKGKLHATSKGLLLRKSLIVFQFMISIGLIIATNIVYHQLMFMKNHDMGYDMSQKLIVRAPKVTQNDVHQYESYKIALQQLPEVASVTASHLSPGDRRGKGDGFTSTLKQPEKGTWFSVNTVDEEYLQTYDIDILHGRGFSKDFPADQEAAVITEEVALVLGYDPVDRALQEKILINHGEVEKEVTVIGIANDVNLYSLKLEQTGVIFLLEENRDIAQNVRPINYFSIDMANLTHITESVESIEEIYKSHFPGNPFIYFFLDDYFNAQYLAEEQFGKVFTWASGLAIFIACLGLFGLAAFQVQKRSKEIGIRKVLGANIPDIWLLLAKDLLKALLIASIIGIPLINYFMKSWLEEFVYKIPLSWWMFVLPVLLMILIALLTVSQHLGKAARLNPVKLLRYE